MQRNLNLTIEKEDMAICRPTPFGGSLNDCDQETCMKRSGYLEKVNVINRKAWISRKESKGYSKYLKSLSRRKEEYWENLETTGQYEAEVEKIRKKTQEKMDEVKKDPSFRRKIKRGYNQLLNDPVRFEEYNRNRNAGLKRAHKELRKDPVRYEEWKRNISEAKKGKPVDSASKRSSTYYNFYSKKAMDKVVEYFKTQLYTSATLVRICGLRRKKDLFKILRYRGIDIQARPWNCKSRTISNCEVEFGRLLKGADIEFVQQHKIEGFAHPFDFFLPEYSILVEIDGDYWHGNPEIYIRLNAIQKRVRRKDKVAETYVKNKTDYLLLRVWGNDVYNSEDLVLKRVLQAMQQSDLHRNVKLT